MDITIKNYDSYLKNVKPTKLTEARKLKLNSKSWGILTEFYLESIKINKMKDDTMSSIAILKVSDNCGETTCIIRGSIIGLLFDLSAEEWKEIENLNCWGEQLYYRHFKNGLKSKFPYEQKLFYNFCMCNQTKKVNVAVFKRCPNMRSADVNNAVIEIIKLMPCTSDLLDFYVKSFRKPSLQSSAIGS